MARCIISPAAERDIESILAWTHERFGLQGRLRYEAILLRAILDVTDDPERIGSRDRSEIAPSARTYHLFFSRDRVEAATGRVRRSRHILLYRAREDGWVEIGRILHDSMDISRHLPEDYTSQVNEENASELS